MSTEESENGSEIRRETVLIRIGSNNIFSLRLLDHSVRGRRVCECAQMVKLAMKFTRHTHYVMGSNYLFEVTSSKTLAVAYLLRSMGLMEPLLQLKNTNARKRGGEEFAAF